MRFPSNRQGGHEAAVRFTTLALATLLAAGAGASTGQQVSPQVPPQPPFRATSTVVQVDVMVTEGNRQFVADLTGSDFEVLEDGKPQAIQTLYRVRGRQVDRLPLVRPGEEAQTPPAPEPLSPAAARAPAAQRVFVLFFDLDHLDQNSFHQLQTAGEKFLESQFQPGDVGGVLLGSTMVGNRLTPNKKDLLAAIRDAKPNFKATLRKLDLREWPRMSDVEAIRIIINSDSNILDQVAMRAEREATQGGRQTPDYKPIVQEKARLLVTEIERAAAQTLRTLQGLNNGLARIPGRKTIMMLTEGFMFENSWGDLRVLVAQAARADVRIYWVDTMGLRRRMTSTDPGVAEPLETGASIPTEAYNTVEEGPNTLAVDTGGYVIRNTNAFTDALTEIAVDTSNYYVIGYSPTNTTFDGKFRSITVRVKRPGVEVRARKGYIATPPAAPPAEQPAGAATPAGAETPRAAPGAGAAAATTPAGAAESVPAAAPPAAGVEAAEPPAPPVPPIDPASLPPGVASPTIVMRPDAGTRMKELVSMRADTAAVRNLAARGWERYEKGDVEGAEKLLGEAAGHEEAAPWVHYALGFSQFALSQPAAAARSWERVRAAVPEFTAVYLDLADAYLQTNDAGRSVSVLREAERRWPANTEVLNALGTIQVRRGTINDAIETFEKAVDRRPEDALAYFNLGRAYEFRYFQMRRFSRPTARWMDNPEDARKGVAAYQEYLRKGGPFEEQAREGIARLQQIR